VCYGNSGTKKYRPASGCQKSDSKNATTALR
jgi:hypothetical protein